MASKAKPALQAVRDRIREAEKRYAPVEREMVPLGDEEFQLLAELVERGDGKKLEVLRSAVTVGLRALKKAGEPAPPAAYADHALTLEVSDEEEVEGEERPPTAGRRRSMVSSVLGAAQITKPPSQERREALEEEEGEEIEIAE